MVHHIAGVLSVIVGVVGYLPYAWGIYKGRVKPHPLSWLTWGIITTIACVAQWWGGAGAGVWVMVVTLLFHYLFAGIGFISHKSRYVVKSDWYYFWAALAAIPLWAFTQSPLVAVCVIIVVDVLVLVPTLRKAVSEPATESVGMWALGIIKWGAAYMALEVVTPVTAVYPLLWVCLNTAFTVYLVWRRIY